MLPTTETARGPRRPRVSPVGPTRAQRSKLKKASAVQRGARLRDLRQAVGLSHERLVEEGAHVAERLGGAPVYEPFTRQVYSQIENGRLHLTKDSTRAILCVLFSLTRDEFAGYLDGKTTLAGVLALREARQREGTPAG